MYPNLTKAQMEDIWHNKPVGYLKTLSKKYKGCRPFRVSIQPYTHNYLEQRTYEVLAKNREEAYRIAQYDCRRELKDQKIDGWRLMGAEQL